MDETLKSIRLLHQVVVVLSAALLAFAITPDERPYLQAALTEVEGLRRAQILNAYGAAYGETAGFDGNGVPASIKQLLVNELGVVSAKNFEFHPAFHIEGDLPNKLTTLQEWDDFFSGYTVITTIVPSDMDDLKTQLQSSSQSFFSGYEKPTISLHKASIELPANEQYLPNKDFPSRVLMDGNSFLRWIVAKAPPQEGLLFAGSMKLEFTTPKGSLTCSIRTNLRRDYSAPVVLGKSWLKADPATKHLSNSSGEFLPSLRGFWVETKALTPSEAAAHLVKRIQASSHTLTFSGITVETVFLIWLAPLVSSFFAAYLAVHLRHFLAFSHGPASNWRLFPWVGLFLDKMSLTLLIITLFVLPLAANGMILWRSFESGHWESLLALALMVLLICILFQVWLLCKRLQVQLQSSAGAGLDYII